MNTFNKLYLFFVGSLIILNSPILQADNPIQHMSRKKAYLVKNFEKASQEFQVPVELLQAIAYVETRWNHTLEDQNEQETEESAQGEDASKSTHADHDRSYRHMRVYGVMGLKNDRINGTSLKDAAQLINQPYARLKRNIEQNIRGAAALLDYYYRTTSAKVGPRMGQNINASQTIRNWAPAIQQFSGLDVEDSKVYLVELLESLDEIEDAVSPPKGELKIKKITASGEIAVTEAQLKIEKQLSPNHSSGGIQQLFVIIHTTQGNYASALSWLRKKESQASAHYLIRSRDGHIVQMVEERDKAWHARCWNGVAIGIEHEGFVDHPEYLTKEIYESSGRLVASIAKRYGIPADNTHIVGHDFTYTDTFKKNPPKGLGNCNSHHDPGPHWDWDKYIGFVKQLLVGPAASQPPQSPTPNSGIIPPSPPKPAAPVAPESTQPGEPNNNPAQPPELPPQPVELPAQPVTPT